MADKPLSAREKIFISEYMVDFNASRAIVVAGYAGKLRREMGFKMKNRPRVKRAIEQAIEARERRAEVRKETVIDRLMMIATADPRKAFYQDEDGNLRLKPLDEIPEEVACAMSEITPTKASAKVKIADKNAALTLLGKHFGMFRDKHEISGPDGAPLPPTTLNVTFVKPGEDDK